MSAQNCPSEEQLQAFLLGKLQEPALTSVAEHLESCSTCEARAQQLDALRDPVLEALQVPIAIPVPPPSTRRDGLAAPNRRQLIAGAALLGILAVAGGVVFIRGRFGTKETAPNDGDPSEKERVFLSDWQPIASANWPLPRSPQGGTIPNCYATISVRGNPSPHGIGLHPAFDGPASVSYALDKRYVTFEAEVSLNDSATRSDSELTFTVHGDDRLLWESEPVLTASDTQACRVSVAGVEILKLEVSARKRAHSAHGVWLEPSVIR